MNTASTASTVIGGCTPITAVSHGSQGTRPLPSDTAHVIPTQISSEEKVPIKGDEDTYLAAVKAYWAELTPLDGSNCTYCLMKWRGSPSEPVNAVRLTEYATRIIKPFKTTYKVKEAAMQVEQEGENTQLVAAIRFTFGNQSPSKRLTTAFEGSQIFHIGKAEWDQALSFTTKERNRLGKPHPINIDLRNVVKWGNTQAERSSYEERNDQAAAMTKARKRLLEEDAYNELKMERVREEREAKEQDKEAKAVMVEYHRNLKTWKGEYTAFIKSINYASATRSKALADAQMAFEEATLRANITKMDDAKVEMELCRTLLNTAMKAYHEREAEWKAANPEPQKPDFVHRSTRPNVLHPKSVPSLPGDGGITIMLQLPPMPVMSTTPNISRLPMPAA